MGLSDAIAVEKVAYAQVHCRHEGGMMGRRTTRYPIKSHAAQRPGEA